VEEFLLAVAVWLISVEHSSEDVSVAECVLGETFLLVSIPLTLVGFTVLSQKDANAMLLPVAHLSFVVATTILVHLHVEWALECLLFH